MGFVILVLDWPNLVRQNWGMHGFVLVDELIILTPMIGSLILVWMTALSWQNRHNNSGARTELTLSQLFVYAWEQFRIYLPFSVLPLIVMTLAYDFAQVGQSITSEHLPIWPFMTVGLLLLICGYPLVLARFWNLQPMSAGALRDRIEDFLAIHQIPIHKTLIWHTGQSIINAMVVSCIPGRRYLILADKVLFQLGADEIVAAVAHEVAHVRRHHLMLRLGALLLPLCVFLTWHQLWMHDSSPAIDHLAGFLSNGQVLPIGLTLLYFATAFGWITRLFELDADLWACRQLASFGDRVEGQIKYIEMLHRLSVGHSFDRRTWLHPSLLYRCDFLRKAMDDKTVRESFLRLVRLTTTVIVTVLFSPLWLMATLVILRFFSS